MNLEQKTFERVIKARRSRESRLRRISQGFRPIMHSEPILMPKGLKKEGFFSKLTRRIKDKMQRRLVPR